MGGELSNIDSPTLVVQARQDQEPLVNANREDLERGDEPRRKGHLIEE